MAFLLVLTLCAVWGLLGWSLLVWAGGRRNVLRSLMLAPSVGVAAVVVLLFELYRLGLPVRLAGPLTAVLIAGGLAWWRVAPPPRRAVAWLALALTLAAAFVGAPLLVDGFAWVSFCNDDMANYVLGAQGLLARGYLTQYPAEAFIANTDASLQLSAVIEAAGLRNGAELLLAWVMSLTGMADHRVFMPVIVALHIALISAAAGLVCTHRRRRSAAWLVLAWLAVAALPVLGAVYQLIAQVLGLGLLAAASAVLLDPARQTRRTALLGGLLAGALGVSYPEVFPFLGLGVLFFYGRRLSDSIRWLAGVGGVVLLVWNVHCTGVLSNFLVQLSSGVRTNSAVLFPYYLIPSGLPAFWGLIPIGGRVDHSWIDIAIAAGAVLLLLAAGAIVYQYRRGEPVGALALGFALLAVWLVLRRIDFGAYKVAMYLWPFAAGAIVVTLWERSRRFLPVFAVLILAGIPTSWRYIATSAGWAGASSGFVEIPQATRARLLDQLRALGAEQREHVVVTDTYNIVLAKFAGAYLHGASFRTPAKDFFATSGRYTWNRFVNWYAELHYPGFVERFREMLARRAAWFSAASFPLAAGQANRFALEQPPTEQAPVARYSLIRGGRDLTVLNRSAHPAPPPFLSIQPAGQVRNHLLLIESELGRNYYLAESARAQGRVALFQLEPDYFRPGHTMAAAGRHLLFEVLGPVSDSQLRIELSASLKADGENHVPPASIVGSSRQSLSAVGRGSARLLSPSITPLLIRGHHYLALDMGIDPAAFPEPRTGLFALYGRDIPLDGRKIVGFVRDISLVTAAGPPPSQLLDFAAGLRNPNLIYSGSYEDGWVAEESFYELLQPLGPAELVLRLNVPDVAGRAHSLALRLDDSTLRPSSLHPGRQEFRVPVLAQPGPRRVHLRFDRAVPLSAVDLRPASARVESLGFFAPAQREIPLSDVSLGDGWHPVEEFGGNIFRWVERDAEVILAAPHTGPGELTLEMEAGPGVGSKAFTLRILDKDERSVSLSSHGGRDHYRVTLAVRAGRNAFRLRPVGGGRRIQTDQRILNFRVFRIEWKAQP